MVPWPPTESSGLFPSYLFNVWSQANSLVPCRLHREANSWAPLPIQTCVAKVPTSVSPRSLEWTPWDLQVSSFHSLESIYSLGIPQLLSPSTVCCVRIPDSQKSFLLAGEVLEPTVLVRLNSSQSSQLKLSTQRRRERRLKEY